MLDMTYADWQKYFRKRFKKSFTNFCDNAPLSLYFTMYEDTVHIFETNPRTNTSSLLFIHKIDYTLPEKQNIAAIKEIVRGWYPSLIEDRVSYIDYTPHELNEIAIRDNIDIDTLMESKKKVITNIVYVIEKALLKKDELIVSSSEGTLGLYKCKIPVTIFLSNLMKSEGSGFDYFTQKTVFMKDLLKG